MALMKSIKHSKSKLAGYIKQAKKLLHGSQDGDRKTEIIAKAKEPRETAIAPRINDIITEPAAATPSEPPLPPKPSTASAPELKGQEPTVDNGDNILLEIASIGESITRILESASDSSSTLAITTTAPAPAPVSAPVFTPTTITSTPTRAIWGPNPNLSLPSSSFSSPAPPRRFQRSPFFGKKIGVTPRVTRIPSILGALDPGTPAIESPTGPTMVAGSENELEGHSEDEGSTLIEPNGGGFERFGSENGGRPYVEILDDIRELLGGQRVPPAVRATRVRRIYTSPPSEEEIEETRQRIFALIRQLRGYLERT